MCGCKVISLQSWGSPAAHWGSLGGLPAFNLLLLLWHLIYEAEAPGVDLSRILCLQNAENEPWLAPIGQDMRENSLVKHCRSNTCYSNSHPPATTPQPSTHEKLSFRHNYTLLCSLKPHGQLCHHGGCRQCCCCRRGFTTASTAGLQ